jgi:transcriptional regulator with XRE-family HTH domain
VPVRVQSNAFSRAFGQAVREERERLGVSQEKLGFASDLDRTYISGIERGRRNPTLKIIWQIARALQTVPSKLMRSAEATVLK